MIRSDNDFFWTRIENWNAKPVTSLLGVKSFIRYRKNVRKRCAITPELPISGLTPELPISG